VAFPRHFVASCKGLAHVDHVRNASIIRTEDSRWSFGTRKRCCSPEAVDVHRSSGLAKHEIVGLRRRIHEFQNCFASPLSFLPSFSFPLVDQCLVSPKTPTGAQRGHYCRCTFLCTPNKLEPEFYVLQRFTIFKAGGGTVLKARPPFPRFGWFFAPGTNTAKPNAFVDDSSTPGPYSCPVTNNYMKSKFSRLTEQIDPAFISFIKEREKFNIVRNARHDAISHPPCAPVQKRDDPVVLESCFPISSLRGRSNSALPATLCHLAPIASFRTNSPEALRPNSPCCRPTSAMHGKSRKSF